MQQVSVRNQRGFTLIELLLVVGISGILGAIAVGAWGDYRESTKADVAKGKIVNMLQQARLKALSSGERQTVAFDFTNDEVTSATGHVTPLEGVDIVSYGCSTCSVLSATTKNFNFKRRGSGTGASLRVSSGNKLFYLSVNGITGRVKVGTQCSAGSCQ